MLRTTRNRQARSQTNELQHVSHVPSTQIYTLWKDN